jgi:hypothetical protein
MRQIRDVDDPRPARSWRRIGLLLLTVALLSYRPTAMTLDSDLQPVSQARVVPDPRPLKTWQRTMLTAVVVGLLSVGLFCFVDRTDLPTGALKVVAAVFAVYGTFAQVYLAADHGAARRRSESDAAYGKRLRWRDMGEMLAWAALGTGVICVVVAEAIDSGLAGSG